VFCFDSSDKWPNDARQEAASFAEYLARYMEAPNGD
jgi:hypothetical protein